MVGCGRVWKGVVVVGGGGSMVHLGHNTGTGGTGGCKANQGQHTDDRLQC